MTGQKQRSGGPRPGSGPIRRRLLLDKETARTLRLLVRLRANPISEEEIIKELVDEKWREIDQEYQEAAEEAGEPYII